MPDIYLQAADLEVHFGDRVLFSIPSVTICKGDRIGLIGANGAGKSTLLQLLMTSSHTHRYAPVYLSRQFGRPDTPADAKVAKEFEVLKKQEQAVLSGGEEARLRLASAHFQKGRLLLLDEPTANLDIQGVALFREKLHALDAFLLVSHDRQLLKEECNQIWSLYNGELTIFPGTYDAFMAQGENEKTQHHRDYERYTQEKSHLENAAEGLSRKSGKVRKAPKRMGNSEARLHRRASTDTQKQLEKSKKAIQTRLEKLETVARPVDEKGIYLDFSLTDPPQNPVIASAQALTYQYPGTPIFYNAAFTLPRGSKTAILGANGSGKTTLMQLLMAGHPALRITPKAKPGLLCQDLSTIDPAKTLLDNALENSVQTPTIVRTVLTRLLFPRDRFEQLASSLSGGEKVKLAFAQLILSDRNVLLLDEPTNYLDLPSLVALEGLIQSYPGTVLFVSHDQAFVKATATRLLILENQQLQAYEGTYAAYLTPPVEDTGLLRTQLQMRMSQLIAKLPSTPPKVQECLEKEYQDCLKQYQALNKG